ncbi:sensor histidine kinase [Paenibacillus hodogayensis]|uniref:Sensor histidine kinase n=1 Tax=Paenibacillus hodogayensis TaxID=279208 RepID=A0ABV5W4K6_9BACL
MDIRRLDFVSSLGFKLIGGFLVVIIPLSVLLIYNNFYAIHVVRNQVAYTYADLTALYMKQVDQSLSIADDYLYDLIVRETDLLLLDSVRSEDDTDYHFAKVRLLNRLSSDITNYRYLDSFFVYSQSNGEYISSRRPSGNFERSELIKEALIGRISHPVSSDNEEWLTMEIGGTDYMVRIVRTGNVYVGAWMGIEHFAEPLQQIDTGRNGKTFFVSGDGRPIGAQSYIRQNEIDWTRDRDGDTLKGADGRYLSIRRKSEEGSFYLNALVPESRVLESLPHFKQIISGVTISSIILLPVVFFYYRRVFLLPIYRLIGVMKRAQEGYLNVRASSGSGAKEFQIMNKAFNDMMAEIGELKIHIYEEKLRFQNAELKHLQMQINPHFFLNALNTVYYFAQSQNYEMIRKLSLSLIQYFRYMFRSGTPFVSLREEFNHIHHYLHIQEVRFPQNLTFAISVEEAVADCLIPPLLIHTFVENTIKHAVDLDRFTQLSVRAQSDPLDPEGMCTLTVRDNGKGFGEEILRLLRTDEQSVNDTGEGIGIWNTTRRLLLAFPAAARISFGNHPEGGALVQIWFPQKRRTEDKEGSEHEI